MNPLKRGRTRLALAALGALGVLAIFVGVAKATGIAASATLTAGSPGLYHPTSLTFSGPLSGTAPTTDIADSLAADKLEVVNPGSTGGWHVTTYLSAPFLCASGGCSVGTDSFSKISITESSATSASDSTPVAPACVGTCVAIGTPIAGTYGSLISTSVGSPTSLYGVTTGGIGVWQFDTAWWVTVDAAQPLGTYNGTLTINVGTGPS